MFMATVLQVSTLLELEKTTWCGKLLENELAG